MPNAISRGNIPYSLKCHGLVMPNAIPRESIPYSLGHYGLNDGLLVLFFERNRALQMMYGASPVQSFRV